MIQSRSRVPLLVLAYLGLVPFVACKEQETHVVDVTPEPTASGTATATATATATPTATPNLKPGECVADVDCPPYAQCQHVQTATGGVGQCVNRPDYHLGRPLVVDGFAHVAPYAASTSVSDTDVATLMAAASEEHASIAAFARTIAELMALGAPTWLLSETQIALADEIRHTELTLDAIERATGGARPVLGALPAAAAPLRRGSTAAADLFRDVFRGGVVGETMAAAHADRQRESATDEALRALYDVICVDEARHAALAFKTLRWLLGERPELAAVLEGEKTRLAAVGSFEERTIVGPLLDVLG